MFRPNNPLSRFLSGVLDQLTLNILYIICCLPVFTIGAATAALYSVQYAMAESRGPGVAALFWQGMRHNFRQATVLFLMIAVIGVILGAALFAALIQGLLGSAFTIVIAAVAVFAYLGTVSWLFPIQARFEQKTTAHLYNAYALSVSKLSLTVLMILLNFWWIPVFFLLAPEYFGCYLFVVSFCQAAFASFLNSRILLRSLKA